MTINLKNAINKVKTAKNEFTTGFKQGYHNATAKNDATDNKANIPNKTGKKLR